MAVTVSHSVTATTPNDPTKEISSTAWNAGHVVSGLGTAAELPATAFDAAGTAAAAVSAHAGAANPHPVYLTAAEGNAAYDALGAASAAVVAHAAVHAPATAQANADITKAEIEAKLTGVIASHSHAGGGSDPWTYVVLASDFVTSSATAVDVTGFAFTPALNTRYEFEAKLMVRTATTTVGPRPGVAWPTGMTDGVASTRCTSSSTANVVANGNIGAAFLGPVGGLPNTTGSFLAVVDGIAQAGATPSGTIKIQVASETAGTNVTVKAGSLLKYRTY